MTDPNTYAYHHQNPYPAYAWLRSQSGPYFHQPEDTWLVSCYEQVSFVLRDSRFSKQLPSDDRSPLSSTMLFQDPPNHRRLRDAVSIAFSAQGPLDVQSMISCASDHLLDRIATESSIDFIQDFASPLPIAIITALLGIEADIIDHIHQWTNALLRAGVPGENNLEILRAGAEAVQAMGEFFSTLIKDSSSLTKSKLLSALIRPEEDLPHGPLTDSELIGTCMLLMIAGHETTVNLLGNGLYLLLTHPDQLALLRDDSTLMPNAIEEILRFESPVQRGTYRCAKEAVEVGNVLIPAGAMVAAMIGAANRDPDVFEDPEVFNILRTPNPHLGFGQGIHYCLGASIARQEAAIALQRLFARFPNICLVQPQQSQISRRRRLLNTLTRRSPGLFAKTPSYPCWERNTIVRGLTSLPIAL